MHYTKVLPILTSALFVMMCVPPAETGNDSVSNKKKITKEVHSSWNFLDSGKKHKVHLGILKKTSLKTKKLDQICSKLENIDLIKIDVDGAELDVILAIKKILNKKRKLSLLIEIDNRIKKNIKVHKLIKSLGFKLQSTKGSNYIYNK